MAPSRGLVHLQLRSIITASIDTGCNMNLARRSFSSFAERLADPSNNVQSYVSRSRDPYLNLSIEDYILRTSPPDSIVLFLYMNRPCVVIGRNQNPWTEVNLALLGAATRNGGALRDTEPPVIGDVRLVRRRSGGGAVFHDEGNLNWSVTCPRADFTRDKHAEMVVRALRKLGVDRARVNERHDIVLDQGQITNSADPHDTHTTAYMCEDGSSRSLKVSGSAYKLTRMRALHHATTLLASPNLHSIPQYLRSSAKQHIQAKGVESVSSPVGNIGVDIGIFKTKLQEEFATMYSHLGTQVEAQTVGEEHLNIPGIRKSYEELRTADWMWAQTPQFVIEVHTSDGMEFKIHAHHGIIKQLEPMGSCGQSIALGKIRSALLDQKLQDIRDWNGFLRSRISPWNSEHSSIVNRLEELLPVPELTER